MPKPIIVYPKRSNDFTDEVVLTKAELQRIVDTAYDDGHKDGEYTAKKQVANG